MIIRLALASALSFAATLIASAALAAAPFSYLAKAAEEISTIEHSTGQLTNADTARIAAIACDALTQLGNDPEFRRGVEMIASGRLRPNQPEVRHLLEDIAAFRNDFLAPEWQLLREAGFDPLTSLDALQLAIVNRTPVPAGYPSREQTVDMVLRLADKACNLRQRIVTHHQATQIGMGVLGAVLIAGDVSAGVMFGLGAGPAGIAITSGLLGASVSVGYPQVAKAVEQLNQ